MADPAAEVQFPINQALLDDTAKLRQERTTLAERMAKIEATRDQVSPQVFERVSGEYRSKFDELTRSLMEKKAEIDRELATLYETRQKVTANLDAQKTAVEELEFRKQLGEFDEKEFVERSKEAKDKFGKFQKIVESISANIQKYESLFADFEPAPQEPSQRTPAAVKAPPAAAPAAKPSTGSTTTIPVRRKAPAKSEYSLPPDQSKNYFGAADDVSERPTGVAPPPSPPPIPKTQRTQVYVPGQHAPEGAVTASVATAPGIKPGTVHLKVVRGAADNTVFPLGKETTIGRAHTNHIVLKEARISRQHAIIRQAGKEFVMEDLQSSNGVLINGERVKEHVLSDGDQIQIGDFVLEFHQ